MLRILILTYYFPPSNATAANRPFSWANNLRAHGIEPVVITRHWPLGDEDNISLRAPVSTPLESSTNPRYAVIRLPYQFSHVRKVGEEWLSRISFLRKSYYFCLAFAGYQNIDMDMSGGIDKFLAEHLKHHHYDALILTTPPFNLIRVAKKINQKYGIPYIVDFRDLWNDNKDLKEGYVDRGINGLFNKIIKKYISNWLKSASLVTVATLPMAENIKQLAFHGPIKVLLNGYEDDLLKNYSHTASRKDIFIIACVGTLYAETDLQMFVDGFLLFIKNIPKAKVQLRLIGIGIKPAVETWFTERIPTSYLITTGRVKRENALQETFEAQVLYMPGWRKYKGILSSRIFEYLASGKNILIAPGDNGVVNELINQTSAGKIAENSAEVCDFLTSWYKEWEKTGELSYQGKRHLIEAYSRERQTAILATYLKEVSSR